jgi:PAS domain S-box-containing protein
MNESSAHVAAQEYLVAPSALGATPEYIEFLPIPYLELTAEGQITRANHAACIAMQKNCEGLVGRSIWDFVVPDEVRTGREAYFKAMESGETPEPVRRTLVSESGRCRTYDMFRSMIHDKHGKPVGMRYALVDITDNLITHSEAHQTRLWLENVLASVGEAVVVADALGFIRYINAAAEELSGWKAQELAGKIIEKAFPLLAYTAIEGKYLSHSAALEGRCRGTATILARHGQHQIVDICAAPIVDKDNGYTIGVVTVVRLAVSIPA